MSNFKFKVGQKVNIKLIDTIGKIRAISAFGGAVNHYELKYTLKDEDGRVIHPISWWTESGLEIS